jgi:hypothetical protein
MDGKEFWSLTREEQFQFVVKNCDPQNWPRYPFMPLVNHTVEPFHDDYLGFLLADDIKTMGYLKVYVGVMFNETALFSHLRVEPVNANTMARYKTMSFRNIKEIAEVWRIDE